MSKLSEVESLSSALFRLLEIFNEEGEVFGG
jgi:hypothetical protein